MDALEVYDGDVSDEGPDHELVITDGMRLTRLFQYTVPPGFRVR